MQRISKSTGLILLSVVTCGFLSVGCQSFAGWLAGMSGGNVIEPQYELESGPLLIMFDDRGGRLDRPRAIRMTHEVISKQFADKSVNSKVIPFTDWRQFKQRTNDYDKLTIREVGEKLGADQVLYIAIERFTLNQEPGAPIYQGLFEVRCKVISTERKDEVREWPRDAAGYRVTVETDPTPADGDISPDDVADQLGAKLGDKVAKLFYEHREQE